MSPHELNSIMVFIHPPLASAGHLLIILFSLTQFFYYGKKENLSKSTGILAWIFTFSGLITGMIWAQLAWNNYWSWDPKEIMTLILFSTYSINLLFYFETKNKISKIFSVFSCALVIITIMISFIIAGLHSFI